MSFINWGNETPEQREFRKRLEEREFLERAMAKRIFEARGANSAATSASAASAGAAGGGGSGSSGGLSLTLEFSSVAGAQAYVPNLTSVASWNNFFDLPTYGNPFTRVEVDEATISLYGGSDIIMKAALFINVNESLISVDDQLGCIIELENGVFGNSRGIGQTNLVSVNFPAATVFGNACFALNSSLVSVNLPSCTNLGGTVGNDLIFSRISGNTIQLTVPAALMTNNIGNPDGDIKYLQANNTVTVTQV